MSRAYRGLRARAPPAKGSRVHAARITTRTCPLVCDAVGGGGGAGVVSRTHVGRPTTGGFLAPAEAAAAGPVGSDVGAAVEADSAVAFEAGGGVGGGGGELRGAVKGRRSRLEGKPWKAWPRWCIVLYLLYLSVLKRCFRNSQNE